eukprot:3209550-Rhodomonas_salina.1
MEGIQAQEETREAPTSGECVHYLSPSWQRLCRQARRKTQSAWWKTEAGREPPPYGRCPKWCTPRDGGGNWLAARGR